MTEAGTLSLPVRRVRGLLNFIQNVHCREDAMTAILAVALEDESLRRAFLRKFVPGFAPPDDWWENCRVSTGDLITAPARRRGYRWYRDGGRKMPSFKPDLWIWDKRVQDWGSENETTDSEYFPRGSWGVLIEAKLWASLSPGQMNGYRAARKALAGRHGNNVATLLIGMTKEPGSGKWFSAKPIEWLEVVDWARRVSAHRRRHPHTQLVQALAVLMSDWLTVPGFDLDRGDVASSDKELLHSVLEHVRWLVGATEQITPNTSREAAFEPSKERYLVGRPWKHGEPRFVKWLGLAVPRKGGYTGWWLAASTPKKVPRGPVLMDLRLEYCKGVKVVKVHRNREWRLDLKAKKSDAAWFDILRECRAKVRRSR